MQLQAGNSHQQSNSIARPLHAGHQLVCTLLWDCIPFVVSQPMWLCLVTLAWRACPSWSHKRSVGLSPFHPLYSQILEEVPAWWGWVQSQTHMGLSLVAESHLDISLYVDYPKWWQVLFLQSVRFCPTQTHCPHKKLLPYQCNNQQSLLHVFTPHFDTIIQLLAEVDHNLTPNVQFSVHMSWNQLKKAWW